MNLPNEIVELVVQSESNPDAIMEKLTQYSKIYEQRLQRLKRIQQKNQEITKLQTEIKQIQQEEFCPHPLTKYHGDPSGGSDSWDECLLCGNEINYKKYRQY